MTAQIVVFGATGYAGGLALDALLARGLRPVVAGGRPDAVRALADSKGGLECRVADATDIRSVRRLVGAGDVLVTTVGPFERFGRTVAQAAVDQGAHYVDSTGEVGFVRDLVDTLGERAVAAGSVMLPAFGYDYVPGTLAGALAAEQAGDSAHSLDIGYFVRGSLERGKGLSKGTRTTLLTEAGRPALVRSGGRLVTRRVASVIRPFEIDGARRDGILLSGSEVLFLPRAFPGLADIAVYNGWFPEAARAQQVLALLAGAISRTGRGADLLARLAPRVSGPAGGPDAATRARTKTVTVAVARDAAGQPVARVELTGPSAYDLTAGVMSFAAEELAAGRGRTPGVVGGIEAFGLDGLREGCERVGIAQV